MRRLYDRDVRSSQHGTRNDYYGSFIRVLSNRLLDALAAVVAALLRYLQPRTARGARLPVQVPVVDYY